MLIDTVDVVIEAGEVEIADVAVDVKGEVEVEIRGDWRRRSRRESHVDGG